MRNLLADNPTLLLFAVAGTGFLLGRVRLGGFRLGVAAVLFSGLAFGAVDSRWKLPDPVWGLGLAVFVYTVGIASGPGFVAALRRRGVRTNLLVLGCVGAGAFVAVGFGHTLVHLNMPTAGGAFAGGLTNTPALAAILDQLKSHASTATFARVGNDPTVGYSLTYPIGVLLPLVAAFFLLRKPSATSAGGAAATERREPIVCRTVEVMRDDAPCLGELRYFRGATLGFSRIKHDGVVRVATADRVPKRHDLVSVIGAEEDVRHFVDHVGVPSSEHLALDRTELDFRRVFVSSRAIAGKELQDLELPARFGAKATRIWRGDAEMVATPDTTLELGDRVGVVASTEELGHISQLFGDSFRSLGEIDVMTFSFGIALGLLLGALPIPLGNGGSFTLGAAGGPLLVGLLLGALGRTGRLVWQLPYNASMTLRQFGMILFLAGVGTRSGKAFADTIASGHAVGVLVTGVLITAVPLALLLAIGRVAKLPRHTLVGVLAGMQTQPAVLAFANERVHDDREVNMGYATVYPAVMIAKIVIAQLIVSAVR